ncbi:MAG: sigma-70 family RNA polymerase sigma factor [Dysgonamonadaceae bacterium]|jgi:RNA polymerase sigma-70 factor (ECF subfamily)|nr:sigma-70 family RNA polymerase sigma factor [Dysgonamonadaceae bacterium]
MSKNNRVQLENDFIMMIKENERIIYKACSFYISEFSPMEDLYQETILNLWRAYPKFRNESSYSTWIYRIALNTCISELRKTSKYRRHVQLSFSDEIAFEPDSFADDLKTLYRLIYSLEKLERAIILLWLEEKSYQEIADITGLSLSNVATKLKRIKEKLKNISNQ